ncbi:MAG: DMT family transporter [Prosthecobacter sp.]|jgi:drug/metabolite transporter (DMT)-like permease|uniref:DMT family transporter n=1 Tax=Prosthecobacter sp. TaxID=1965333 RepID=UPI0019DB6BD4|nr:DMT family transporter [Prosthecobacter sp.]MBE2283702.1 DMT family transporter [Prosthecobacter sp.]
MSTPSTELQHHPRRGTLWMFLSLTCFTGNALLLKVLASVRHADPWMALTFRAVVGLLLTIVLFAPAGSLKLKRSFQSWLLASRGVLGALGTAAYYITIGPLGAGKATLIGNTWTIFAAIMAAFVLHEKLGVVKVLGILLAMAGLSLLTGIAPGTIAQFGHHELIALTGAVLAAAVVVVIRQLTRTESSATIFSSQCIYAVLLALPFAMSHFKSLETMDVCLLTAAALCASVGQLAMTEGFRFLSVAAGGAFQMLVPVVISLSSILLFAESFTFAQAMGGVLVLWGSYHTVVGGFGRKVTNR